MCKRQSNYLEIGLWTGSCPLGWAGPPAKACAAACGAHLGAGMYTAAVTCFAPILLPNFSIASVASSLFLLFRWLHTRLEPMVGCLVISLMKCCNTSRRRGSSWTVSSVASWTVLVIGMSSCLRPWNANELSAKQIATDRQSAQQEHGSCEVVHAHQQQCSKRQFICMATAR